MKIVLWLKKFFGKDKVGIMGNYHNKKREIPKRIMYFINKIEQII